MIRFLQIIGVLIAIVGLSFAGWYYQPWAQYSPSKVAALQDPAKFPQTFQTMDDSLPYRTLQPAAAPRALPAQPKDMITSFMVAGEEMTVADYHASRKTTGLVVLKDGVIVHEAYFLGADENTTHTSWSVAKSVVATAIFKALKDGKIESLDDKAEKYAPKYAGTDFGSTSLKGLLAMASGVNFDENYAKENSDIRRFFFDAFIKRDDVDDLLRPYKRNRPEFTDFTYISPNTQVLSAVLRGIYDKPLADLISEEIWQPLGMESEASWSMHRPGYRGVALGYCCLNATGKDYARFGQFWLETLKGTGLGVSMLPENASLLIRKPASENHMPNSGRYGNRGYSHHFWLPPNADFDETGQSNEVFAAGVYGQYIWMDVKRGIVIARNAGDAEWTKFSDKNIGFFRAVARHYGGE